MRPSLLCVWTSARRAWERWSRGHTGITTVVKVVPKVRQSSIIATIIEQNVLTNIHLWLELLDILRWERINDRYPLSSWGDWRDLEEVTQEDPNSGNFRCRIAELQHRKHQMTIQRTAMQKTWLNHRKHQVTKQRTTTQKTWLNHRKMQYYNTENVA